MSVGRGGSHAIRLRVELAVAFGLLSACAVRRRRVDHLGILGALAFATGCMTVMTYDLATEDYARLFSPVGVCLCLTVVLAIAASADALLARRTLPLRPVAETAIG